MSYFEEQQEEWFAGGMWVYAKDKGVKVNLYDIPDEPNEDMIEKAERRLYKALGLDWSLQEIPGDYDPYNQCVDRD